MAKRVRSHSPTSPKLGHDQGSQKRPRASLTSPISEGPSATSAISILSWNVETPLPFLALPPRKAGPRSAGSVIPGSNPSLLCDLVARHGYPDFVCLQEVRAKQSDKEWIAGLKAAINKGGGPQYTAYMSLNRAVRGQRHFGVVTYAKHPERIAAAREVDWDAEGRVVILEMTSGWALVNVYALNGSEYLWHDPLGQSMPTTRNERKREFNRLLMEECRRMQARGLRVVLLGDFNISLTARDCMPRLRTEYSHALARREFREGFMPGLGVVDVYRELHGDRPAFSWFARGKPQGADCARVDYALVEASLVNHVADMTYLEDSIERAHSDHTPFVISLRDMDELPSALPVQHVDTTTR